MNKFSNCTICNSKKITELKKYSKDYLVKCGNCGFVFSQRIPTLDELVEEYAKYERSDFISPITIGRYNVLLKHFEQFRSTNKIIDIGAGNGQFLEYAKTKGWEVHGTEFEERAVEICREKGIQMQTGKFNPENYKANSFDIIFSGEVIEHINNPQEEIANFNKILRVGGLVYITTPNFNSLSHKILKANWSIFNYPEHISYYTPKTINFLFKKFGFKKIFISTTSLSISRFKSTTKNNGINITDEQLREKTETKPLWKLVKKTINGFLNITQTGDALKAEFIKITNV